MNGQALPERQVASSRVSWDGWHWTDTLAPASAVRRRFTHWWQSKISPLDQVTLTQRNVYILPTGAGAMMGVTLLVMLIAAINYQLNLGYLLSFVLAGNAVAGVYLCHNGLRGLRMQLSAPEPVFAGQACTLTIQLHNARSSPRYALGLAAYPRDQAVPWVYADVPAQSSAVLHLRLPASQRGWQALPALTAETRYPLGTFRVWTVWRPASRILVYPQPEARPPPLPWQLEPGEHSAATAQPSRDNPDGVREYQRGDALRLIVWRKVAKSDQWVSRDASSSSPRASLWLDWQLCAAADKESKVSRLCAWVLLAEQEQIDYGLRLPSLVLAPAHGATHKHRCLEALALC